LVPTIQNLIANRTEWTWRATVKLGQCKEKRIDGYKENDSLVKWENFKLVKREEILLLSSGQLSGSHHNSMKLYSWLRLSSFS
jgi:hypothetical protein